MSPTTLGPSYKDAPRPEIVNTVAASSCLCVPGKYVVRNSDFGDLVSIPMSVSPLMLNRQIDNQGIKVMHE